MAKIKNEIKKLSKYDFNLNVINFRQPHSLFI